MKRGIRCVEQHSPSQDESKPCQPSVQQKKNIINNEAYVVNYITFHFEGAVEGKGG
jgi:hypothetical protein